MLSIIGVIFLFCFWTECSGDTFDPPCNDTGVDIERCNRQVDDFIKRFYTGPDFAKAIATFRAASIPPIKNCSASLPPEINGKISAKMTRDYCQWYTNKNKQLNVYMEYEVKEFFYSCDYDPTDMDFSTIIKLLEEFLKNPIATITSCAGAKIDGKSNRTSNHFNLKSCLEGIETLGWLKKGSFGGTFYNLMIVVQFHFVNDELKVDKIFIDNHTNTTTKLIPTCSGDKSFKSICKCFTSFPGYEFAAEALVDIILGCAVHTTIIKDVLKNTACNETNTAV